MTTKPKTAALYLRSSKDRSDVSIEAQRHELGKFAAEQGIDVVTEFVDVVESGKDEDRPGFLDLYSALRARDRGWNIVLAFDTSRIARRRHIAVNFERECVRRGVRVQYKSMAGVDPETEVIIMAVFQGMDEWHSVISKRKARAGMATNVRRGFRAGGRAPIGYKLAHIDTGAVRDGRAVMKSRLVLDDTTAPALQRYLKSRAAGLRRAIALKGAGMEGVAKSSLVGIEWNALTYAGFTVWNVNQERDGGSYVEATKRRPRAEWVVQPDTHPALITQEEAEHILAQLEAYSLKKSRHRSTDYLLTGLLKTSGGASWKGQECRYYRAGTKRVTARDVDASVREKVAEDLSSRDFAQRILARVRATAGGQQLTDAQKLRAAAAAIEKRISGFMDMAASLETRGPVLRKIEELERDRLRIEGEIATLQREAEAARAAKAMTEETVAEHLDVLARGMKTYDRERLKTFLGTVLTGITLDPGSDELQLHYKIELRRGLKVASPRIEEPKTVSRLTTYTRLKRAA